MQALFYPKTSLSTSYPVQTMGCLILHGAMRSELCGCKPLSIIRSGLHFPLEMLLLYHQDISKLTSIFFSFLFFKAVGQMIFPSNFFPVTKIIMKNNFYFEFFSAVPLLIFPLAHWKLWERVWFFSVERTWENLVRLFVEKEQFFFYSAFCLQFCITFLWKYMSQFPFKFLYSVLKKVADGRGELGTPHVNQLYSFIGCIY